MANHRRKKPRRQTPPHRCSMCEAGQPKRCNGKRRWRHRDRKRMVSVE